MLVGPENNTPENVVTLQDNKGFEANIKPSCHGGRKKLAVLDGRRREELPLSDLLIGMQCGGSDAFSGVTANPAAGYAADMLVQAGATVLFSEVTEVRDGVHLIAERCVSAEVRDPPGRGNALVRQLPARRQCGPQCQPHPRQQEGRLSNIVEKAMGSIAKSGSSPIVEVLSPPNAPAGTA